MWIYLFLLILSTYFHSHVQKRATLLDVVPFNRAHPIKHQCSVDSLIMHSHPFNAMSPCICNARFHCLFVPCPIDECYIDNFNRYAYHKCILGNYIKHAYNFSTLTHSYQCITQTYINITYKSLLSQIMEHFIL